MEKQRSKTSEKREGVNVHKSKDKFKGGGDIERQRSALDDRIRITDVFGDSKKNVFRSQNTLGKTIKVEHVFRVAGGADIESTLDGTVDKVIDHAAEVIGSRDEAMRWLGTPVRGLDFATPISLLGTKDGVKRVNNILGQMEHGIW